MRWKWKATRRLFAVLVVMELTLWLLWGRQSLVGVAAGHSLEHHLGGLREKAEIVDRHLLICESLSAELSDRHLERLKAGWSQAFEVMSFDPLEVLPTEPRSLGWCVEVKRSSGPFSIVEDSFHDNAHPYSRGISYLFVLGKWIKVHEGGWWRGFAIAG